jgi:hypothetical protein
VADNSLCVFEIIPKWCNSPIFGIFCPIQNEAAQLDATISCFHRQELDHGQLVALQPESSLLSKLMLWMTPVFPKASAFQKI